MTVEERITALEALTQDIHRNTFTDPATGTPIPGLQINARVGVFTNFWMNQPIGQGAALSIGTAIDRYAVYAEIDGISCPDHPSVAVFASNVAPNAGQDNHAIEGVVGNGRANYGLALTLPQRTIRWRTEGLELLGDYAEFFVGKVGGVIRQLWP